jgi:hypothetical protein
MKTTTNLTSPNLITGPNAGGLRQLAMQTRRAARIAQFWRWLTNYESD